MATWLAFGLVELGRLEAPDRVHAEALALARYPTTVKVQSLASYQVTQSEAARRTRVGHDGVGRMARE